MSNTAAIALIRLVLSFVKGTTIVPDFGTPDLVDDNGFRVTELARFREIAIDRFDATDEQAMKACLLWVSRYGRTHDADSLPRLVKAA